MKLNLHYLGLLALVSMPPALSGCNHQSDTYAAAPASAAPVDRVTAGSPQRKTLVTTTAQPARIEAFETTPLYSKLAGYVGKVHADIGDEVKAGQALVTLHVPELEDEVAQKAAHVRQAEAEVKQAAANVVAARAAAETAAARVAVAKAGIARSQADVERWRAELSRIKQLAASGSVTQKLVDETQSQYSAAAAAGDEAAAAMTSAEAGAREAEALIAKAEADEAAAKAKLGVAEADLKRAETMLGYASITAPFNGVVTQRSIDTGHFVQPANGSGAKPLMVVACTDKVRIYLDVPEMEAGLVTVGDPVTIRVQAMPQDELKATVTRTSWSLESANRSLRVEVDVPNERMSLRPGMYATGTIELERRENALTLPVAAVNRQGAEPCCCCVVGGKIERRPVKLGLRSGAEIEIVDGLSDGDAVVLARAESLEDGQAVEVIQPQG
jgi:HlyD family secretion protein